MKNKSIKIKDTITEIKETVEEQNVEPRIEFLFKKKNYMWMIIGLVVIAIGFSLMAGGGSDDPNVFNEDIFSWTRIRLAPTLVLIGFGIEAYAILLNPDK